MCFMGGGALSCRSSNLKTFRWNRCVREVAIHLRQGALAVLLFVRPSRKGRRDLIHSFIFGQRRL
jgi:hypothetical protein